MRGSSVIGASIWDSGNRWITIHGTNYLVVRDCVGYRSRRPRLLPGGRHRGRQHPRRQPGRAGVPGAAAAGSGPPVRPQRGGRLLVGQQPQRLHAQRRRRVRPVRLPLRGAGDARVRSDDDGPRPGRVRRPVDIRTLPFIRFEDNEAHAQRRYGVNLGGGPGPARPGGSGRLGRTFGIRSRSEGCGSGIRTGRFLPRRRASWSTGSRFPTANSGSGGLITIGTPIVTSSCTRPAGPSSPRKGSGRT